MKQTEHVRIRMGQRGIPAWMLDFVRRHGEIRGDSIFLDRRGAKALLDEADRVRRQALKVLDKGGVAIIEDADSVITTYNMTARQNHD